MDDERAPLPERLPLSAIGRRSWQFVGLALAVGLVVWLLAQLIVVVAAIAFALFLAATFSPPMEWLAARGWPRTAAALTVTVSWLVALMALFSLVGWRFAETLPELIDQVSAALERLREQYPQLPVDVSRTSELLSSAQEWASSRASGGLRAVGEFLSGAALAIVLSFFLLRDGRDMWQWTLALLGDRSDRVDAVAGAAWNTVSQYVQGLCIVALADAALSAIGLFALGVPMAAALVVLTFLAAFVPVVGAFVVGGLAVALAFAGGGTTTAVIVLILYVAIQQVDGNLLQPFVMGNRLPLHPAVVLVVLTVGGLKAGIVGALFAVPLAAALSAAAHAMLVTEPAR
ncbi:AI-2E family transporter [Euzebya tangerina]|uniref:AI-2E family transporter n=1 Tax=Euzebya tangerina TaxID=591198 RepID=UPI0013C34024|nr:AI-2E family transporter [Euzebya tangerina]